MLEGYLFPIFRDQNAFYLSGFIETNGNTDEPPMMVAGQPNTYEPRDNKNTIKRQTRVFAIDPDEGTVY
jgi:hypothetical protein